MANLIIKQYDTFPSIQATLSDTVGAINLTTASSVLFVMKGRTTATIITGTCAITDAVNGKVSYTWALTDTQVVDTYDVEFQITWPGGPPTKIQKVPNAQAQNPQIEIDAELDPGVG